MFSCFALSEIYELVLSNIHDFNVVLESDNIVSTLVFSNESVKKMFNLYSERKMTYCVSNSTPSIQSYYKTFKDTWDLFVLTNKPNWIKKIEAYNKEYNPIENYNMTESEITHRDGDNIITTKGTFSNNSNSFNDSPTEVRNYVTSDENQNGRLDTYSTSNSDVKTENGGENDSTTNQTLADVKRDLKRSGNIGVTTSQTMLKSELELRKMNITNEITRQFIEENTFLSYDMEVDFCEYHNIFDN